MRETGEMFWFVTTLVMMKGKARAVTVLLIEVACDTFIRSAMLSSYP